MTDLEVKTEEKPIEASELDIVNAKIAKIQQEYQQLCTQFGHLHFTGYFVEVDKDDITNKVHNLNKESKKLNEKKAQLDKKEITQ